MKLYIAGPMRGFPEFNFPAFFAAETFLKSGGFEVINPAAIDEANGFPWRGAEGTQAELDELGFDLRRVLGNDLQLIATTCDGVFVLDGWQASKGAVAEVATARALGLGLWELGPHLYDLQPIQVHLKADVQRSLFR